MHKNILNISSYNRISVIMNLVIMIWSKNSWKIFWISGQAVWRNSRNNLENQQKIIYWKRKIHWVKLLASRIWKRKPHLLLKMRKITIYKRQLILSNKQVALAQIISVNIRKIRSIIKILIHQPQRRWCSIIIPWKRR